MVIYSVLNKLLFYQNAMIKWKNTFYITERNFIFTQNIDYSLAKSLIQAFYFEKFYLNFWKKKKLRKNYHPTSKFNVVQNMEWNGDKKTKIGFEEREKDACNLEHSAELKRG